MSEEKKNALADTRKKGKKKAAFVNSGLAWGLLIAEAIIIAVICFIVFK